MNRSVSQRCNRAPSNSPRRPSLRRRLSRAVHLTEWDCADPFERDVSKRSNPESRVTGDCVDGRVIDHDLTTAGDAGEAACEVNGRTVTVALAHQYWAYGDTGPQWRDVVAFDDAELQRQLDR